MGQCCKAHRSCTSSIENGTCTCANKAVLYGKCEAHLTDRDRAVLELVRAAEAFNLEHGHDKFPLWNALSRAITAVKEP